MGTTDANPRPPENVPIETMKWMRTSGAVLAAVAALVLAGAACTRTPARDRPIPPLSSGVRLPATPDALPTFDLGAYRTLIAAVRGKPVVVNIWASWCGPCTAEAPELAKVSRRMRGQVQFLGIDII